MKIAKAQQIAKRLENGRCIDVGGDVWVVMVKRADGKRVVITDTTVQEWSSEAMFYAEDPAGLINEIKLVKEKHAKKKKDKRVTQS